MATQEVTFYPGMAGSIQIPGGPEISTLETGTLVNSEPGVSLTVPALANIAAFTPVLDMRVATAASPATALAKKSTPKTRLFRAGVQYYLGVAAGGNMNFLLEV